MLGIHYSNRLKQQEKICEQLINLCDLLLIDISTAKTPVVILLNRLLKREEFACLNFMSEENVKNKLKVSSVLSNADNSAVSDFLYSLGKYSASAQISAVNSFKQYIELSKSNYRDSYNSKSKVYISFGFSAGIIMSLVLV